MSASRAPPSLAIAREEFRPIPSILRFSLVSWIRFVAAIPLELRLRVLHKEPLHLLLVLIYSPPILNLPLVTRISLQQRVIPNDLVRTPFANAIAELARVLDMTPLVHATPFVMAGPSALPKASALLAEIPLLFLRP